MQMIYETKKIEENGIIQYRISGMHAAWAGMLLVVYEMY